MSFQDEIAEMDQFEELTTKELLDTSAIVDLLMEEDEKKKQQDSKPVSKIIRVESQHDAITQLV